MTKSVTRRRRKMRDLMDECYPLLIDGRLVCPHGQDLHPVICPHCKGKGCNYCYGTGMQPGCKICRGQLLLLGEIRMTDDNIYKVGKKLIDEVNREEGWPDKGEGRVPGWKHARPSRTPTEEES